MQIPIKNKLSDKELFRVKRMKEVIKTTHPHGHKDYLEIIFLTQGEGVHQIDHHRYHVQPSGLYLVMPGQIHHWELTAIPKGFVAMVQQDFLVGHPLHQLLFRSFPAAFSSGFQLDHIHDEVTNIFARIEAEYSDKRTNFEAIIQTYLQLLFNLLQRETTPNHQQTHSPSLTTFYTLLDEHYQSEHEVNWYAETMGVTAKTLNTTCRKFLNKTAGTTIAERITVEAKKLLLYSDQNLGEIAYALGFGDLSHFNKFFRRQTGVLPGVYRKGIS